MNGHIVPDTSVVIKWFRQGEILAAWPFVRFLGDA
jgi:hypothetical protein